MNNLNYLLDLYNKSMKINETSKKESTVPVISSIKEFLDICKERGIEVEKSSVKKQGKTVNAKIADKDQKIKSREGEEIAHKGDLIVDDGENTYYAVNSNDIPKYYEVDKYGNSITGDNTKWKKIAKTLDYYITPFDVDVKVQWQKDPLHATKGYSLVCNDKDGKDISPVNPKVFNDETLWKKTSLEEDDGGGAVMNGSDGGEVSSPDSGSDVTDVISPDNSKTPNTGLTTNDVLGKCDHNKDGVFGPGCFHYPDFLGLYSRVSQPYFKNTKKKKKHLSYSNDVKEN